MYHIVILAICIMAEKEDSPLNKNIRKLIWKKKGAKKMTIEELKEYLEKRIKELEEYETANGGFNLYDEVDIGVSTQLETYKEILKLVKEGS